MTVRAPPTNAVATRPEDGVDRVMGFTGGLCHHRALFSRRTRALSPTMLHLIPLGFAFALLTACAGPTLVTTQTPTATDSEPEATAAEPPTAVPERAIPDNSLYPLLVAEFALRRRDYDVALDQYMAQAPLLRDAGVSAHATHLAQFMSREYEALQAVQLWVELEPENLEANNTLAILLVRQGKTVEALPHFARLARAGEAPKYPTLLNGFKELTDARRAQLVQGIEALGAEFPDDVQLLLTQAMIQAEFEQFELALARLDQIFQIEPDQQQAALLESRILLALKKKRPYERIQRLLAANPQNKALRLQYARLLTATDIMAARQQFEILSAQSPRDGDLLLSLALINRETGNPIEAKAYLRQLLALEQRTDEAHYYLGRTAEDEGDRKTAIMEYSQVEDGREFLIATNRAGILMIELGQFEESRARFDQLRQEHFDLRTQLYGMEAELLSRAGKLNTAMAILDHALTELPDSSTLRYSRSMVAEQQGNLALMESDLRLIIAREPDNSTALNALGYTLANRTTRYDEAFQLISRALELQPGEPAILDSMGWVLYRMNRHQEAVDYLTQAYAAFPDPEVAAHLGEVLWISGDTESATKVWQGALLKDPGNGVLADTFQRLGVTHLNGQPVDTDPLGRRLNGSTPIPASH